MKKNGAALRRQTDNLARIRSSSSGGRAEPPRQGAAWSPAKEEGWGDADPHGRHQNQECVSLGGGVPRGGGRSSVSCKGGQHYSETVAFSVGHLKKQHRPSRGDPRRW